MNLCKDFVPDDSISILESIAQLAVTRCPEETSAVILEGAVLLAVRPSTIDADEFPFTFLIGLPHGREISPYLSNFFKH
jgi:hypothetical protein